MGVLIIFVKLTAFVSSIIKSILKLFNSFSGNGREYTNSIGETVLSGVIDIFKSGFVSAK